MIAKTAGKSLALVFVKTAQRNFTISVKIRVQERHCSSVKLMQRKARKRLVLSGIQTMLVAVYYSTTKTLSPALELYAQMGSQQACRDTLERGFRNQPTKMAFILAIAVNHKQFMHDDNVCIL